MRERVEFRGQVRPAGSYGYATAVLAAMGLLSMTTIGMSIGVAWSWSGSSWWRTARYLGALVTWPQWLGLIAWAAVTGALFAAGVRCRWNGLPSVIGAVGAGAVVPVGLVLLAGTLGHVWPGTTGPTDVPALTLLLVLYSLVMPWVLGRGMRGLAGRPFS